MIDLDANSLAEVRRILREHAPGVEVRAFGSRVTGTAARYADLDLALVGSGVMENRRLEALKDAFAGSDLAVQVDLLDWHALSPAFRILIEEKFEIVQEAGTGGESSSPARDR